MNNYSGICVIMIEQSIAMTKQISYGGESGPRSKALNELVSTAINSAIKQLGDQLNLKICLFGYNLRDSESLVVDRRGQDCDELLVEQLNSIVMSPLRTEQRTVGSPNGTTEVEFPIYFDIQPSGDSAQNNAWAKCLELLKGHTDLPSLIVNISHTPSADGNPRKRIEEIMALNSQPAPLIFQIHLANSDDVQTNLYTSNGMSLPSPKAREIYSRSSLIPDAAKTVLRSMKEYTADNSRLFLYNAKMVDLAKAMKLLAPIIETWPSETSMLSDGEDDTIPTEKSSELDASMLDKVESLDESLDVVGSSTQEVTSSSDESFSATEDLEGEQLDSIAESDSTNESYLDSSKLIFLINRGVDDPYSSEDGQAFSRLQSRANRLIDEMSSCEDGMIQSIGMMVYGTDFGGQPEITLGFEGDQQERLFVPTNELTNCPIRILESEEEIPNGVGGLITIPKRDAVYFEGECSVGGGLSSALEKLRSHNDFDNQITILHLIVDGLQDNEILDLQSFVSQHNGTISHIIETKNEHAACKAPIVSKDVIQDSSLERLYELSSENSGGRLMCINTSNGILNVFSL